ncbi:MAG: protein TolR [Alphaproteobacteria bacterium]|nr:protein TolR [Alphaproteobacteria bacterium]
MQLPQGGRARHTRRAPMSEINVTPLVDVMLVLLIVFMVTAPLLTTGVNIDLPKTSAQQIQGTDEPLEVSIDAQGRIYLQKTEVRLDELVPRLTAIVRGAPERRIFVRGDKAIGYGRVMEVMGTINAAGFTKVALLTERPAEPRAETRGRRSGG